MKKPLALIVYVFAIGLLSVCAAVIIVKLIFWPPCTQTGSICVVDGWSIAGLAASILGVSATVLSILGAVGVAGWWLWLNDRVQALIKDLYEKQKLEVKQNVDDLLREQQQKVEDRIGNIQTTLVPLEDKVEQIQTRIEVFNRTLDDFEDSIAQGFAAMGPLVAGPVAQKALDTQKFPTLPFYMTRSYLDLLKQENKQATLEREIARYQALVDQIQLPTDADADLPDNARSELETQKILISSYLNAFNKSSLSVVLANCREALYWWRAAKDNRPKTPALKSEDFDNIQAEARQIEKIELAFDKFEADAQSMLSRIDNLLQ